MQKKKQKKNVDFVLFISPQARGGAACHLHAVSSIVCLHLLGCTTWPTRQMHCMG
jgi:hypothetical protein